VNRERRNISRSDVGIHVQKVAERDQRSYEKESRQLKTGLHQTQSEVAREGLRLLKEREDLKQLRLAELRKEIAIGSEQADRGEFVDGKRRLLKSADAAPTGSSLREEDRG
jgi:Arc/MetJ-type ribon-helix-helix transcriptional regulator